MRYNPGGTSHSARRARRRRRRRLRRTADPTRRPMANATCGGIKVGSGTNEHHSESVRTRMPSRLRRMKASRSRTRPIKPTGGLGPWPDGPSAPRVPHGYSCGRGSRACGHDDACLAGRYASRRSPDGSRQNHDPCTHTDRRANNRLTTQGYGRVGTRANRPCKPHRCKLSTPSCLDHLPSVCHISVTAPDVDGEELVRFSLASTRARFAVRTRPPTCPHLVDNGVDCFDP